MIYILYIVYMKQEMTKILLNIPIEYKNKLDKIVAMEIIETNRSYSLTQLIIETLEKEFGLKNE